MISSLITESTTDSSNELESASRASTQPRKARICRFFSTTGSCRAGSNCAFLHDDTILQQQAEISPAQQDMSQDAGPGRSATNDRIGEDGRQAVSKPVPASRVVTKPVPAAQIKDPREFQLGQIRRRFTPKESKQPSTNATLLKFSLTPSDPDFPFEMTALDCLLSIPLSYPKDRPSLKVGNRDIPRGFALNVEFGFENLANDQPGLSLLELIKALDKNLETFLSAPKAETVRLVPNKDTRHLSNVPSRSVGPPSGQPRHEDAVPVIANPAPAKLLEFTVQQKSEAVKRRETETRQLEARMGRLPLYKKSSDGIAYTLPVEPRRRAELPVALQAIKTVQLFVPLLYPLQPCRIQLEGVEAGNATPVEIGFLKNSTEKNEITLMVHMNFLAQNVHLLAKTPLDPPKPVVAAPIAVIAPEPKGKNALEGHQDPDRSHIQYITRPLEWTVVETEDLSGTDTDDLYSYDTEDESSNEEGVDTKPKDENSAIQPIANQEKGTSISFPFIELYGIELLEIVVLNITVRCERCKDTTEIKGLKNGISKTESCRKCASPLSVCFRRDLIHAHAVRAGFLDLEGCIIGDMLPSTFIPTCSSCSEAYPMPGIVTVQGNTTSNNCRNCHGRFTFTLPSVKFLRITSSTIPSALPARRKKTKLGVTPGTALPKQGRCRHYAKSYRWFRFSCCEKVYACDKCHDEEEEHPNEWAKRMVCGWCSREQNYKPEECGICHGRLVGKKGGGGFWEGGKGTRDRVKMSRKDPRKFRRPGGAKKT